MLGFLRRIRRSLIEEGQLRKYLVYAVGEILLVVVGILIALQINNWNQNANDRAEEQSILLRLRNEFVANRIEYERSVSAHYHIIHHVKKILELTGPMPVNYEELEVDSSLFVLLETNEYNPEMGQFEALLNSGKMNLIQNDSLQTALAGWPSKLSDLRKVEQNTNEGLVHHFLPYLFKKYPLRTMDYRLGFFSGTSPSSFPLEYNSLLTDLEFENHVEARWATSLYMLEAGESVLRQIDLILSLIEDELNHKWITD